MKLSEEQIKNMEWEDIEKTVKGAIESGDMEFITSTLPLVDLYWDLDADYFLLNFDHDLFKNRDIALQLAKCGQIVPADLYENDEEMILASVSASGRWGNGFELAGDKYINDKEFVKKMFAEIDDYEYLSELLGEDSSFGYIDSLLPEHVLEGGEIEQFIKDRIQELKEKREQDKENAVYEETSEAPSELEQLASTKKELEQIVGELKENIASAQKLLASYEELLNGGKQNDSNEGQTFGEE